MPPKFFTGMPAVPKPEEWVPLAGALKEHYDRILKNEWDAINGIPFKGVIPGIDSILCRVSPIDPRGNRSLSMIANYKIGNRPVHETVKLNDQENLYLVKTGLPSHLRDRGVQPEAILSEVLDDIERTGILDWAELDFKPFPPGAGAPKGPPMMPSGPGPVIDPAREAFLRRQNGFIRRFKPKGCSFEDYWGIIFKKFIYLDNPKQHNAAYFIDLPEDRIVKEMPPHERAAFNVWLKNQPWVDLLKRTRSALRQMGMEFKVHDPNDWEAKIQAEIDKRK